MLFEDAKAIERATPVPQLMRSGGGGGGGGHRKHMQRKKKNRNKVVILGKLLESLMSARATRCEAMGPNKTKI